MQHPIALNPLEQQYSTEVEIILAWFQRRIVSRAVSHKVELFIKPGVQSDARPQSFVCFCLVAVTPLQQRVIYVQCTNSGIHEFGNVLAFASGTDCNSTLFRRKFGY